MIGHDRGLLGGRGALAIVVVVPVAGVVERKVGDCGSSTDAGKRGEFLLDEVQGSVARNGHAERENIADAEAGRRGRSSKAGANLSIGGWIP